jgi:hypothetical protein
MDSEVRVTMERCLAERIVQGDGICKDVWNKIEIVERLLMCVEIGATRGGAAGASILPFDGFLVVGLGRKGEGTPLNSSASRKTTISFISSSFTCLFPPFLNKHLIIKHKT